MSDAKTCIQTCRDLQVSCPNTDCRSWINYQEDLNCVFESIEKFKDSKQELTLREVSKRIGCSFVRVKQIEEEALKKINKSKIINIDDFI
jgi:hypothetical protein